MVGRILGARTVSRRRSVSDAFADGLVVKLGGLEINAWRSRNQWIATVASQPGLVVQTSSLEDTLVQALQTNALLDLVDNS